VVGGGEVATRKVLGLLAVDALVTVCAPALAAPLAALAADGRIRWWPERYAGQAAAGGREGDRREGPWAFVVAATDDGEANDAVVADAAAAGTWANHAGAPDGGPAALPAVAHVGAVTVAVSTGGANPGAARWLRDRAVDALGPEPAEALALLEELGATDRASGERRRRADWRQVVDSGTLELIREGRRAEAKERLQACLSSSSD
jgi:siroheme synthase-like protein